ncbi:MAG: hypothetical protein ACP5RP_03415 [Candidatus Micrarchaeia archaeon]
MDTGARSIPLSKFFSSLRLIEHPPIEKLDVNEQRVGKPVKISDAIIRQIEKKANEIFKSLPQQVKEDIRRNNIGERCMNLTIF